MTQENSYVNFLELPYSKDSGSGQFPPRTPPWFSDIRYSFRLPISGKYPSVVDAALKSQCMKNGIAKSLAENRSKIEDEKAESERLYTLVAKYLKEMRSTISKTIIRWEYITNFDDLRLHFVSLSGYFLFKIFRRLINRLLVCPFQLDRLKEAEQLQLPIIYLPLHKSHLDYLILTWTLWQWDIKLPHVASGNNLKLSGFGWLLRSVGSFFIRRGIEPSSHHLDPVYRATLYSYMAELLRSGQSIEFFAEGTRNRFGKTLTPKNGLLSLVLQCCCDGTTSDALLVPVCCSYERTVEGLFWTELMGVPKQRESVRRVLAGLFKGLFGRVGDALQCGNVRLDFGIPVRVSDYISAMSSTNVVSDWSTNFSTDQSASRNQSYRELHQMDENCQFEPARNIVRAIGYHLMHEAQSLAPITATSAVCSLLLTRYRDRDPSLFELALDLEWLAGEIIFRKNDLFGFWPGRTDARKFVLNAIELLGRNLGLGSKVLFVKTKRSSNDSGFSEDFNDEDSKFIIQVDKTHRNYLELAYFRNSVSVLFSLDGVVAISAWKLAGSGGYCQFSSNTLINDCLLLCDLLRNEFIFCKPCGNIRESVEKTIKNFCLHLLRIIPNYEIITNNSDCLENEREKSAYLEINRKTSQTACPIIQFYANLISPFLISHVLVLHKINQFEPEQAFSERQIVQGILMENTAKVAEKFRIFIPMESKNADSLKNTWKYLLDCTEVFRRKCPESDCFLLNSRDLLDSRISTIVSFL